MRDPIMRAFSEWSMFDAWGWDPTKRFTATLLIELRRLRRRPPLARPRASFLLARLVWHLSQVQRDAFPEHQAAAHAPHRRARRLPPHLLSKRAGDEATPSLKGAYEHLSQVRACLSPHQPSPTTRATSLSRGQAMMYVETSMYAVCLLHALRHFRREQFLFLRYEDLMRMDRFNERRIEPETPWYLLTNCAG